MAETKMQQMRVTGSRVVGTVTKPLRESMQKAQGGWGITALQVAAIAASFLWALGVGASFMLERQKNAAIAQKSKEVLTDYYRNQVAAQLGIDPKKVRTGDLEMAAKVNPTIANAIAKVDRERNDNNRANTFASGASIALGGMVPGLSGISHLAAHTAVTFAGGAAAGIFNKDVLHTQDMMEHLNQKRVEGKAITAADIVMLRISQDEALQEALKKQNGKPFHKMNEAEQQAVIVGMPDMADAADMAERINQGFMTEQDVLMAAPAKQSWASRVSASRAPRAAGSFVEQHQARLAAAQTAANGIA